MARAGLGIGVALVAPHLLRNTVHLNRDELQLQPITL